MVIGIPCFRRVVRVAGLDDWTGREEEIRGLSVRRLWISGFLERLEVEFKLWAAARFGVVITPEEVGGRRERASRKVERLER